MKLFRNKKRGRPALESDSSSIGHGYRGYDNPGNYFYIKFSDGDRITHTVEMTIDEAAKLETAIARFIKTAPPVPSKVLKLSGSVQTLRIVDELDPDTGDIRKVCEPDA